MPDNEKDKTDKNVAFDDLNASQQREFLDSLPLPELPTTSESIDIRNNVENAVAEGKDRSSGKGR